MNHAQKRILLSLVLIAIAVGAFVIGMSVINSNAPSPQVTSMAMTIDPTILSNMTQVADATPLSSEDAEQFLTFQEQVEACDDYDAERREQMLQHVGWLVDPAEIPPDVMLAIGTNPQGGLIFGMASYTQIQWRLLDRPAESCLVDIGRDLNVLLEAFGRQRLTIYDEIDNGQ